MRRRFLFCLLLLGLLLLLPFCAQANEINRLYVWDGSVGMPQDGSLAPGAIQWYSRNGIRYLFLPSGLDSSKLFVHFTGSAKSFTANGVTVPNNSVTDVFVPGTTVTISNGGNSYRVAVMQSANAASVYIKTKSGGIMQKGGLVATEMESVSAASEEQSASASEIADASTALAELAQSLQNSLQKFKF